MIYRLTLAVLAASVATCMIAAGQTPLIAVAMTAKAHKYQGLGDAQVEIRIANKSGQALKLLTGDSDPPVMLFTLSRHAGAVDGKVEVEDALRRQAIVSRPEVKDGSTRNREYELRAGETKSYNRSVLDLLTKEQQLSEPKPEILELYVILGVVVREDGTDKVRQFRSNNVRIEIDPPR